MPSGPSQPRSSGQIIVCGQTVGVDWDRVYNFRDHPDFDASQLHCFLDAEQKPTREVLPFRPAAGVGRSSRRFAPRSQMHGGSDLGRLQQIIRQFVIHHDGLFGAHQCFHVLHDERGLSAHFIIDNDGTIYQTLDLMHGAYHASGVNACSIGVEICNRGVIFPQEEHLYRGTPERGRQRVRIHGAEYLMWQFTEPQYQAMIALGQTLLRVFPNLPQVYPQDSGGGLIPTTLSQVREYSGYLGHFHVTRNKWDPGCFDFARVVQSIGGKPTWFVMPGAGGPTAMESDPLAVQAQAQLLLENNRHEAMGGYFPVGPCGDAQVWHGGIHLSQSEGTTLYCPFPGRLAAARYGASSATGSNDFILTEHRLTLRGQSVQFFLLLVHLDFAQAPPWLIRFRRRQKQPPRTAEVFFPEASLAAGELLGQVGLAGPPGAHEGQIHVEIMSLSELGGAVAPGVFRAISPHDPGPFCSERELLGPLGRSKPTPSGTPKSSVLRDYFQRSPDSQTLQAVAVRFQSEWIRSAAREERLLRSPDFVALPAHLAILRDQIRPTQWWTPEVARRVGLPEDGMVWHYHPVTFLRWVHSLIQSDLAARPRLTAETAEGPSQPITDGLVGDSGFVDDEDRLSQEDNSNIGLQQILDGWPELPAPPRSRPSK